MLTLTNHWFKFKPTLSCLVKRLTSNSSTADILDFSFQPKFSNEEREKILNYLNQSNKDELLCLNVAQSKIKNLENYKKKNGPFKSLDELLDVDGLSLKMLEKLCKQIISEPAPQTKKTVNKNNDNKKIKQFLIPSLQSNTLIASSVGIHLSPVGVSWTKIQNNNNHLESWGYDNFGNLPKKMCPTDSFKLACSILNQLPDGDVYVFEGTPNMGLQGQKQSATVTYTQQLELTSMLLALINTSSRHNTQFIEDDVTNCVYFLRAKLAARLFRTLVGNECVSCTAPVLHLLGESPVHNFILPCTPINYDITLKNDYLAQSSTNRELLGQALMLTVAFVDLCIRKNPVSIKSVVPGKR